MGTPSEDIVAAAKRELSAEFGNGRSITIRRLLPLDNMKLAEIIGPENVKNDLYFGYAILAYRVTKLDGEAVPRVSTKRELEALVQRLGTDGFNAIGEILKPDVEAEQSVDEARDAVKN